MSGSKLNTDDGSRSSPADLAISLDRDSPVPLVSQLATALRAAAANGALRLGQRLPSTRELAGRLGVSRTVTAVAYDQLRAEGWLAGRLGSGTYLAAAPQPATGGAVPPGGPRRLGDRLDLPLGSCWANGLDRTAWRRAWRGAGEAPPRSCPDWAGLPEYRTAVTGHLLLHRELTPLPETVLATAGTTAGLMEVARSTLRPGDPVAVEEPGYQRAVDALRMAGTHVVPAPVDRHGLVVEAVPRGVQAVYCTPAHQYPLGGQLRADRRVALVSRARDEGFLVVEDEYDGELRYDVSPLPMLAALGPDVVVQLGTMSKILTTSLGVGWLVGPPRVTAAVLTLRQRTGIAPPEAGQRVVVELARSGDLDRHLRKLRRELAVRRDDLVEALTAAGFRVLGEQAGAHVLVPLPSLAAEEAARAGGAAAGLGLDGLSRHYAGLAVQYGVPIGYAACSRGELAAALPSLVEVLRRARQVGYG